MSWEESGPDAAATARATDQLLVLISWLAADPILELAFALLGPLPRR
jgi:hypothetical protein